ncbi:Zinc finger protein ZIC 5 [Cytospora mali]|uniref:Zinc finger protein ZIC 5 n=1 Tax=Cytospora mali TaxID=578113 RepID=A0A194VIW7_CYTMA|nr:Zinc finger protein ZIC 5 [Valsa mali]
MTTAAASNSAHDLYDPDAVVPQNSPLLVPKKVTFRPSPSPPLDVPLVQVSPPPSLGGRKTKRHKIRPSQGDAVLIGIMDNGRHPDIATRAGQQALPSDSEEDDISSADTDSSFDETEAMTMSNELGTSRVGHAGSVSQKGDVSPDSSDLKSLAGGALAFRALALGDPKTSSDEDRTPMTAGDTDNEASRPSELSPPPATVSRPPESIRKDDRPQPLAPPPYSPTSYYSPRTAPFTSPTASLAGHGELPPIQNTSPRSDTHGGMSLPSIRDQLGVEALSPGSFQHSPPIPPGPGMPRLPSLTQVSPPRSPHDPYSRDHRSSHGLLSQGSYYSISPNGLSQRHSVDFNGSTPGTDQSASTPATSTHSTHSVADRMSLDGMAFSNPQEIGQYICKFEGCKAPPFQTQYLLNSHANVHSQSRPHYCPVKGCPRSEGGRGFKRKNEMIRHGLVHDSPGHVRVHHVDKDKDDPALRDVLSQRPDGPSRGRRRRGGPM